jgi:mono/diheme cytochrome c family protein
MIGRRLVQWAIGGGLVLAIAAPASAQKIERKAARPIASVEGVDTFKAYCAVCHGPQAKGNGPAAKALSKTPADLTTITKRHGNFSQNDVENIILGTQEMISHGTRDMPMWGPVFLSVNSYDNSLVKLRLSNLVEYLKSIQTQ